MRSMMRSAKFRPQLITLPTLATRSIKDDKSLDSEINTKNLEKIIGENLMKESNLRWLPGEILKNAKDSLILAHHQRSELTLVMRMDSESSSILTTSTISSKGNVLKASKSKKLDAMMAIVMLPIEAKAGMLVNKTNNLTDTDAVTEAQADPIELDGDTEAVLLKPTPSRISMLNLKNQIKNPSNKRKISSNHPLPTSNKCQLLQPRKFKSMQKKMKKTE
jgi:hypothetical protein